MMTGEWLLEFRDGSGNLYRVERKGETGCLMYSPVKKAMSSSGFYDGGEPAEVDLDLSTTDQILSKALALRNSKHLLRERREKGTGYFKLVKDKQTEVFIIRRSDELSRFSDYLNQIKAP